jgi:hypothetical protein
MSQEPLMQVIGLEPFLIDLHLGRWFWFRETKPVDLMTRIQFGCGFPSGPLPHNQILDVLLENMGSSRFARSVFFGETPTIWPESKARSWKICQQVGSACAAFWCFPVFLVEQINTSDAKEKVCLLLHSACFGLLYNETLNKALWLFDLAEI